MAPVASAPSSGSRPVISPAKVKATYAVPRRSTIAKAVPEQTADSSTETEVKMKKKKEAEIKSKETLVAKKTEERPLIALDWHRTLSFEDIGGHGVAERSAEILRDLQSRGYEYHSSCKLTTN